jgi:hypothetical protein
MFLLSFTASVIDERLGLVMTTVAADHAALVARMTAFQRRLLQGGDLGFFTSFSFALV